MSEVNLGQEPGTQPTLVDQVMQQAKTAYLVLDGLHLPSYSYQQEDKRPESVALANALGAFAAAHLEDVKAIPDVPFTDGVEAAITAYTKRVVADKLGWAIFDEYEQQQAAEMSSLLAGKTITATSLRQGHGLQGSPGDYQNMVVTGPLMSYDASQAAIWIGEPDRTYRVALWDRPWDPRAHTLGELTWASTLEIR
jgi:hypothetical protein